MGGVARLAAAWVKAVQCILLRRWSKLSPSALRGSGSLPRVRAAAARPPPTTPASCGRNFNACRSGGRDDGHTGSESDGDAHACCDLEAVPTGERAALAGLAGGSLTKASVDQPFHDAALFGSQPSASRAQHVPRRTAGSSASMK